MTTIISNAPMRVVTAADEKYLPFLACHLISLGEHASEAAPMEITVIQRGISRQEQQKLELLIPGYHKLRWVEPNTTLLRKLGAPPDFANLSPHYFRLLIPFLMPNEARAIYLDADTIVLKEVFSLWVTDLEDRVVAAVRDYLPCVCDAVGNWEELRLNPNAPYFNSGVLVMDLVQWRREKISQRALSACQKYQHRLLAQGKWNQYDQYGLNVVIHGNWKALNPAWNHGADLPQSEARIVHFVGNGKPALPTCQPLFSRLFFDTLARTSYAGRYPADNNISY